VAFTSCKIAGVSEGRFASFNLANHVGDDIRHVQINRQRLPNYKNFVWLNQVHGIQPVILDASTQAHDGQIMADACITQSKQQVCAVMTADCLPILLCDLQGQWVGAVHAGWRGLAAGIIENTISQMPINCKRLIAWLGPAISQNHFEVGQDVYDSFADHAQAFQPSIPATAEAPKYLADLYSIAKQKLLKLGVSAVYGGEHCTYAEDELFYSHRRATHSAVPETDGIIRTGRMVSAIYMT
jgi:YfiH family protein